MFELKEIYRDPTKTLGLVREQVDGKEVIKLRGPFQEMNDIRGNKNKNGRVYKKELWEKALADKGFQERLSSRRILGELDHPTDDGQIRRTSHIITKVWPDNNDGIIYGEIELLNHNQGDAALLRALVEQGVQICVSSRGFGDFLKDGCTVDPETYKLHTWDVVLDPSVPIAALNRVAESVNASLAPESRSREKFLETTQPAWVSEVKNEEINNNIQKETDLMEDKILQLMEQKGALAVDKAKLESVNESLKSLVTEKNAFIDRQDKVIAGVNEKLGAVEAKVAQLTEDLRKANEKAATAEATLKEYESIEERAIDTIESLRSQIKEYDSTGDRAADLIESLRSQVNAARKKNEGKKKNEGSKKREAGEDDLAKIDKKNKDAGPLRSEEVDGDDDEKDKEKEEDAAERVPVEDDPDAEDQVQQDEESDDADADDEKDGEDKEEGEEEDDKDKATCDEEEETDDEKMAAKKDKEEAKVNPMLKSLSESIVRDMRPAKR